MSEWSDIPYAGSFQRGAVIRTGEPLTAAWRHIERFGTVDNLGRIAAQKQQDVGKSRVASLRMRQAVELRRAAQGASILARPLMLYYSALNLVRGVLLTYVGDIGGPSHGLRYRPGAGLLDCTAEFCKTGTFVRFAGSMGLHPQNLQKTVFSLRDLFAIIPELKNDFQLLHSGHPSIATVHVEALIDGDMTLEYRIPGHDSESFRQQWVTLLPWLADKCALTGEDYILKVLDRPADEDAVASFCQKHLLHDLRLRDDATWYDHVVGGEVVLMPRLPAYLAMLFILSNVSRYEPEFLDAAVREPTDLGYFLHSALDSAERFFPQLVLELLQKRSVFFT
jgi:hypothetical protein